MLTAAVGESQELDGREAASHATQMALKQLGRVPVALGLVIASQDYPMQQVMNGVSTLLGDAPLLGFSTSVGLSPSGQYRKSVVVALLAGNEIQVKADWWPGLEGHEQPLENSQAPGQKLIQSFLPEMSEGILLLAGEGIRGDTTRFVEQINAALNSVGPIATPKIVGCLAGGHATRGITSQIGGQQAGSGGMAAAWISGDIAAGVGSGHGWDSIGTYVKVTKAQGTSILELDERSPAETLARLFRCSPRDWTLPPLNELVRLYPLGFEANTEPGSYMDGNQPYMIRSPLLLENDGSLRMNAAVQEGSVGYLMVGNVDACLEAAREAAHQALTGLKQAAAECHPVLALVLVDEAWRMLMEVQPGQEVQAVRSVLGPGIPVVGGYTFGQISQPAGSTLQLLNQHLQVILFAEIKADLV